MQDIHPDDFTVQRRRADFEVWKMHWLSGLCALLILTGIAIIVGFVCMVVATDNSSARLEVQAPEVKVNQTGEQGASPSLGSPTKAERQPELNDIIVDVATPPVTAPSTHPLTGARMSEVNQYLSSVRTMFRGSGPITKQTMWEAQRAELFARFGEDYIRSFAALAETEAELFARRHPRRHFDGTVVAPFQPAVEVWSQEDPFLCAIWVCTRKDHTWFEQ